MDGIEIMGKIADINIEKSKFRFSQNIKIFCESYGISYPFSIEKIKAGRNSKVFQIKKNSSKWILKEYFQDIDDPRNRLKTEYDFLSFLNSVNIDSVAKAIASDDIQNWGLYSFLPGGKPLDIKKDYIRQAAKFIQNINEYRFYPEVKDFSNASEACFSIRSHIDCINKRIIILEDIVPMKNIDLEVIDFVQRQLIPAKNKIIKNITDNVKSEVLSKILHREQQILSPSDFGFQNTLVSNNKLNFLDFEYSGWDDPAKLICDFGCHPEISINDEFLMIFKKSLILWMENAKETITRSEMLMPLYRLKWCCIMLNEFTSSGKARRSHAGEKFIFNKQFEKSKNYFNKYIN